MGVLVVEVMIFVDVGVACCVLTVEFGGFGSKA